MNKDISIYVHIPFCNSKCYYCSFCSKPEIDEKKQKYFIALEKEIKEKASQFSEREVKTIYFGGGTPSSVDATNIVNVLRTIQKNFVIKKDAEITIECNPASTSEEKLKMYFNAGFNRVSFGIQSLSEIGLKKLGRFQNNKQVFSCLKQAKTVGYKNISADLMLGLPIVSNVYSLKRTIKRISKYVMHFSTYMLMVEEGTRLFELVKNNKLKVSETKALKEYKTTVKCLNKLGYKQYEVSNFAKEGFESKHNVACWNMEEYLGFGLSAHSFYNGKRLANTTILNEYVEHFLTNNENEIQTEEKLTTEQLAEETIMLSLRTKNGLSLKEFANKFYCLEIIKAKKIDYLLKNGLIEIENDFLKATENGMYVLNKIILELV